MSAKDWKEISARVRKAVREVLTELSAQSENETVAYDELCLAVLARSPGIGFGDIAGEVGTMVKESAIDCKGYNLRMSILDMLAAL